MNISETLNKLVRDTNGACERLGRVPASRYRYDELCYAHPGVAQKMTDRLRWWVSTLGEKGRAEALRVATSHSEHRHWLLPVLSPLAANREVPAPAEMAPLTSKALASDYRALFPYLANTLAAGSTALKGYKNDKETVWFAVMIDRGRASPLRCVGYQGDVRSLTEDKLRSAGYARLAGDQASLVKQCRQQIGRDVPKEAVKRVGLHVSAKSLAGIRAAEGAKLLSDILEGMPSPGMSRKQDAGQSPKV